MQHGRNTEKKFCLLDRCLIRVSSVYFRNSWIIFLLDHTPTLFPKRRRLIRINRFENRAQLLGNQRVGLAKKNDYQAASQA
jgi:hypothetical protein